MINCVLQTWEISCCWVQYLWNDNTHTRLKGSLVREDTGRTNCWQISGCDKTAEQETAQVLLQKWFKCIGPFLSAKLDILSFVFSAWKVFSCHCDTHSQRVTRMWRFFQIPLSSRNQTATGSATFPVCANFLQKTKRTFFSFNHLFCLFAVNQHEWYCCRHDSSGSIWSCHSCYGNHLQSAGGVEIVHALWNGRRESGSHQERAPLQRIHCARKYFHGCWP